MTTINDVPLAALVKVSAGNRVADFRLGCALDGNWLLMKLRFVDGRTLTVLMPATSAIGMAERFVRFPPFSQWTAAPPSEVLEITEADWDGPETVQPVREESTESAVILVLLVSGRAGEQICLQASKEHTAALVTEILEAASQGWLRKLPESAPPQAKPN